MGHGQKRKKRQKPNFYVWTLNRKKLNSINLVARKSKIKQQSFHILSSSSFLNCLESKDFDINFGNNKKMIYKIWIKFYLKSFRRLSFEWWLIKRLFTRFYGIKTKSIDFHHQDSQLTCLCLLFSVCLKTVLCYFGYCSERFASRHSWCGAKWLIKSAFKVWIYEKERSKGMFSYFYRPFSIGCLCFDGFHFGVKSKKIFYHLHR